MRQPQRLLPEHWMLIHWLDLDEQLSTKEDWGIFNDIGNWCIRRRFIDLCPIGVEHINEADAWVTVMLGETLTHDKARNFIRDYSPQEWHAMLRYTRPRT